MIVEASTRLVTMHQKHTNTGGDTKRAKTMKPPTQLASISRALTVSAVQTCNQSVTTEYRVKPKFHLTRHVSTRHVRRVEPFCSKSSTQPKCMGSTRRSGRVETWRTRWNLGCRLLMIRDGHSAIQFSDGTSLSKYDTDVTAGCDEPFSLSFTASFFHFILFHCY